MTTLTADPLNHPVLEDFRDRVSDLFAEHLIIDDCPECLGDIGQSYCTWADTLMAGTAKAIAWTALDELDWYRPYIACLLLSSRYLSSSHNAADTLASAAYRKLSDIADLAASDYYRSRVTTSPSTL